MKPDPQGAAGASVRAPSAADVLLRQLALSGIDYFFANGGTDFPPIVKAYALAEERCETLPLTAAVVVSALPAVVCCSPAGD